MKKIFTLLLIGIFCIGCSSDSDSSSSSSLSSTPMAKAEFDTKNFGIYKGVFSGSSGTVLINIKNDSDVIKAVLVIDGTTYNFTCTEDATLGQAITGLTFTSGDMSFDVNVSATGDDIAVVSSTIPAHPGATFNIIKEYSTDLVRCYQGTYTGSAQGTLNLILIDQEIYGLSRSNEEGSEAQFLNGSFIENQINGSFNGGGFSGSMSGNNISGQWQNDLQESGTWTGRRTL
ncbi:hypothetical protein G4D82_00770 [Flavobacterium sp. CYK-4]|uniref:hypothetical protein n=1 Tax=Flavobacterium lotistagni TaxID=2709660 RepID=UPI0014072F80|nr:hypothetical protein [Flavobacterium lotistagni]NHM05740.1 hypothetical protein [Flavobacterium lotistagni]